MVYSKTTRLLSYLVGAVVAMGAATSVLAASRHTSVFSVYFLGVPVGKMTNSISFKGNQYAISGVVKPKSLISVFARVKATFSSSGKIVGTRIIPSTHKHNFKTSKKKGVMQMSFSGGNVQKVSANPVVKYKPGTVPVEKGHLDNVLDPLSSLIVAVKDSEIGNGQKICNRTLAMFNGKERSNLRFTYKSKQVERAEGFKGETFTCAVRYEPVSGFRPKHKDIKFMKANKDLSVTLAQVGSTNLYTLFSFKVRTQKGVASGKAYKFISQ